MLNFLTSKGTHLSQEKAVMFCDDIKLETYHILMPVIHVKKKFLSPKLL